MRYFLPVRYESEWHVAHRLPGGGYAGDCACPTYEAARAEAERLNRAREREQAAERLDRRMRGVRP